jgi:hypothetical protein
VYQCSCSLPVLHRYSLLSPLPRKCIGVYVAFLFFTGTPALTPSQEQCISVPVAFLFSQVLPTDCHLFTSTVYQCSYGLPILQT